jgi:hypothetical protein
MNRILSGFIVYLCFTATGFGQTTVNFDSCFKFIQSSYNDLNIHLYENILDQKITSYWSDSLATKQSPHELVEGQRFQYRIQNPSNPDDPNDLIDTIIHVPFNPKTDFNGATMFYERIVDQNTYTSSFKLWSYAGTYNFDAGSFSFGSIPRFQVSAKDVLSTIQPEDVSFYQSLLNQRTVHAEFVIPAYREDLDHKELAYNGISASVFGGHYPQVCNPSTDSILAWYNFQLFSALADKHWMEGGLFYKDVKLKTPHDPWLNDFNEEFITQIRNPDRPDDPFDFIDTMLTISFEFAGHHNMEIIPNEDDYIIALLILDMDDTLIGRIYYSFNELSKYALPSDQVVMRRMLRNLAFSK